MSKDIPPSRQSKRQVLGGRPGRAPGGGFSDHSSRTPGNAGLGSKPAKGSGSRALNGRPPKNRPKPGWW